MEHPNPLWLAWRRAVARGLDPTARDDLVRRYAFAIPDEPALDAIRAASPNGVIEVGAGTGYWARLLIDRGADVLAFDTAPAPSPQNKWFAASTAWAPVAVGDETTVDVNAARTLLLIWPTRNEDWAAEAVQRYARAGGTSLVYVGERIGGRTGDDRFHALIGEVDRCWSCSYRIPTAPCVCGITPLFRLVRTTQIPRWAGFDDDLRFYEPNRNAEALTDSPPRTTARRGVLGKRWRNRR